MGLANPFNELGLDCLFLSKLSDEQIQEIVKAQYRKLQSIFHPDKIQGLDHNAEELSRRINQAYEVISNQDLFPLIKSKFLEIKGDLKIINNLKDDLYQAHEARSVIDRHFTDSMLNFAESLFSGKCIPWIRNFQFDILDPEKAYAHGDLGLFASEISADLQRLNCVTRFLLREKNQRIISGLQKQKSLLESRVKKLLTSNEQRFEEIIHDLKQFTQTGNAVTGGDFKKELRELNRLYKISKLLNSGNGDQGTYTLTTSDWNALRRIHKRSITTYSVDSSGAIFMSGSDGNLAPYPGRIFGTCKCSIRDIDISNVSNYLRLTGSGSGADDVGADTDVFIPFNHLISVIDKISFSLPDVDLMRGKVVCTDDDVDVFQDHLFMYYVKKVGTGYVLGSLGRILDFRL